MTTLPPGRIPCPDCGHPIALPVETVLAALPIACAGCGLELQVKREDSAAALAALGRWWSETAPARATAGGSAEALPSASVPRGRRPRR